MINFRTYSIYSPFTLPSNSRTTATCSHCCTSYLCLIPIIIAHTVKYHPTPQTHHDLNLLPKNDQEKNNQKLFLLGSYLAEFSQTFFSERPILQLPSRKQVTNDRTLVRMFLDTNPIRVFSGVFVHLVLHSFQQNTSMLQSVNNNEASQTHIQVATARKQKQKH